MKTNITRPTSFYEHPYGELIHGGDTGLIKNCSYDLESDECIVPLHLIHPQPYSALFLCGVENARIIQRDFMYVCDVTNNQYCAVIPVALLTRNLEAVLDEICRVATFFPDWKRDILLDQPWVKTQVFTYITPDSEPSDKLTSYMSCWIGSGYTQMCSSFDGHFSKDFCELELDNGDRVICVTLVWHNK